MSTCPSARRTQASTLEVNGTWIRIGDSILPYRICTVELEWGSALEFREYNKGQLDPYGGGQIPPATTDHPEYFGPEVNGQSLIYHYDPKSGKNVWHFQTGSSLYAGAITYMVDGRQYVLMPAGTTLTAFALADF